MVMFGGTENDAGSVVNAGGANPTAVPAFAPTDTPTPAPTSTPTVIEVVVTTTPLPTVTPAPTRDPGPTATLSPTRAPTATKTPVPSRAPMATATPVPTLRPTPTPRPTPIPAATSRPNPTAIPRPTATPTPIFGKAYLEGEIARISDFIPQYLVAGDIGQLCSDINQALSKVNVAGLANSLQVYINKMAALYWNVALRSYSVRTFQGLPSPGNISLADQGASCSSGREVLTVAMAVAAANLAGGPGAIYVGDLSLLAGPAASDSQGDDRGNVPLASLKRHEYVFTSDYYANLLEKARFDNPTRLTSSG